MIKKVIFSNFKALRDYTIHLKDTNVFVGPNNAGKSTVLDGFKALAGALRYAKSRLPGMVRGLDNQLCKGHIIPLPSIPINLLNIHSDYEDVDSYVKFFLSNGNSLTLLIKKNSQCVLCLGEESCITHNTKDFQNNYPIIIASIPTLGPLEEEEKLTTEKYLKRWGQSRRSHRLLRNIWYFSSDNEFDEFRIKVEETWPGMSISKPEIGESADLIMFCQENRMAREVTWAGFGFQVWLQILTHLLAAHSVNTLVVDEPDIYLHPDLQHKLYGLLKETNKQVLLATHSVEMINEAEHDEIVLIDKAHKRAKRITDIDGLQEAIYRIGSAQNIHLAKISKEKKVLFFEGKDFKLLKRFAKCLGLKDLASDIGITSIPLGGFSERKKVEDAAWTFNQVLRTDIKVAALFDRDYHCDEEISAFLRSTRKIVADCYVLERKEFENYLLDVNAIAKAILERLKTKNEHRQENISDIDKYVRTLLLRKTKTFRTEVIGQIISKRQAFYKKKRSAIDSSTIITEATKWFDEKWGSLDSRIQIVPGKQVLSALNQSLQNRYGISITPTIIVKHISPDSIPNDLKEILNAFNELCKK